MAADGALPIDTTTLGHSGNPSAISHQDAEFAAGRKRRDQEAAVRASQTPDPRAEHCAPSPRTVEALLDAGRALAGQVRRWTLRGPRPVFLYYITLTFEALSEALASGARPLPRTPAQQLCLSLMIAYAEECLTGRMGTDASPPIDFTRVRAELLPDDSHSSLAAVGRNPAGSRCWFDFVALGDALSARGMSAFFAPFESDDLAA